MGKKSEAYLLGLNHRAVGVWVANILRPCFSFVMWSSGMEGLRQLRDVGLGPSTVDKTNQPGPCAWGLCSLDAYIDGSGRPGFSFPEAWVPW